MILKRIVKTVSFLLVFVIMFLIVQSVMVNSSSVTKNVRGLYAEEENTIDVLFLGASSIRTSFNAPYLYEGAGFTSYLMSYNRTSCATYKTMIKEALKTQQTVKLIFVDLRPAATEISNVLVRTIVDNLKMSENKVETFKKYAPEDGIVSLYVPLEKNHSRWKDPKELLVGMSTLYYIPLKTRLYEEYSFKELFIDRVNPLRGSVLFYRHSKRMLEEELYEMPTQTDPLNEKVQAALIDFMNYAKTLENTEVVFVVPPYFYTDYTNRVSPHRPQQMNTAKKLVESYGFTCIDFSSDEMMKEVGLIREEDFRDSLHTNVDGGKKMTNYLIKYISEHYDLPDHRTRATQNDIAIDDEWKRAVALNRRLIDEKLMIRN